MVWGLHGPQEPEGSQEELAASIVAAVVDAWAAAVDTVAWDEDVLEETPVLAEQLIVAGTAAD